MLINNHIHTTFSDGESSIEDNVNAAKEFGVSEIGFTDHISYFTHSYSMDRGRIKEYLESINNVRNIENEIKIKVGPEIDYSPETKPWIKSLTSHKAFDFFGIAVHWINGHQINSNKFIEEQKRMSEKEICNIHETYYNLVKESAELDIDVIAHLDIIKRYSKPRENTRELIRDVLETIKEKDKVIELNMAGKKHPCKELYPSEEILKLCYESEIPVTLSNDAHRAEDLVINLDIGMKMLKDAGYDEIATFEDRNLVMVEI